MIKISTKFEDETTSSLYLLAIKHLHLLNVNKVQVAI